MAAHDYTGTWEADFGSGGIAPNGTVYSSAFVLQLIFDSAPGTPTAILLQDREALAFLNGETLAEPDDYDVPYP